jgi:hypothetical protein
MASSQIRLDVRTPRNARDVVNQIAGINDLLYRSELSHAEFQHLSQRLRERRRSLFLQLSTDNLAKERNDFARISRSSEYNSHVRGVARKAGNEAQRILGNRRRANAYVARQTNPNLAYQRGRLPLAERRYQLNRARHAAAVRALQEHLDLAERRNEGLPFFESELMTPSSLGHQLPLNRTNQKAFLAGVLEVYGDVTSSNGGWFHRFVAHNIHRWFRESFVLRGIHGAEDRELPSWRIYFSERKKQGSLTFHFEIKAILGSIEQYSFEQHAFVAFTVCAFWDTYVSTFIPGEIIETDRRIQFPPPSSTECGGSMFDAYGGGPVYISRTSPTEQCNRISDLSDKLDGVQEDPAASLFEFQGSDTSNPDSRQSTNSILTIWHDHFATFDQRESDQLPWTCDAELVMFFKPTAFNNFNNRLLEILQVLDPNYRDLITGHLNTQPVVDASIDEA